MDQLNLGCCIVGGCKWRARRTTTRPPPTMTTHASARWGARPDGGAHNARRAPALPADRIPNGQCRYADRRHRGCVDPDAWNYAGAENAAAVHRGDQRACGRRLLRASTSSCAAPTARCRTASSSSRATPSTPTSASRTRTAASFPSRRPVVSIDRRRSVRGPGLPGGGRRPASTPVKDARRRRLAAGEEGRLRGGQGRTTAVANTAAEDDDGFAGYVSTSRSAARSGLPNDPQREGQPDRHPAVLMLRC